MFIIANTVGDLTSEKKCRLLIKSAKWAGCDAVVFPLSKEGASVNYDWVKNLKRVADDSEINLVGSVSDREGPQVMAEHSVRMVKFAYRQRLNFELMEYVTERCFCNLVFVCTDVLAQKWVKPQYSAHLKVMLLYRTGAEHDCYLVNHGGLYGSGQFSGFSSHELGTTDCMASCKAGSRILERHLSNVQGSWHFGQSQMKRFCDKVHKEFGVR